jgi:hypothetical protein
MMHCGALRGVRPGRQGGMATLAVALLMLIVLTMITLYAARMMILEQRISRNEQYADQAFEVAQAGLDFGLAYLNANRSVLTESGGGGWGGGSIWSTCPGSPPEAIPCGDGTSPVYGSTWLYVRDIANTLDLGDSATAYRVHYLTPRNGSRSYPFPVIHIIAEGRSDIPPGGTFDNGRGRAVLQLSVRARQLFRHLPPAPLLIQGDQADSAPGSGAVSIWGRANALGPTTPFSIWASGDAEPLPAGNATCEPASYPLCTPMGSGADIVEGGEIPALPADLFQYVFGLPRLDAGILKDSAHEVLADCSTLPGKPGGLYWITGDCTIDTDVGTLAEPVMLVVEGDLSLDDGIDLYGGLYVLDTATLSSTGSPNLHGVLFIDGDLDLGAGGLALNYDDVVLANLNRVGGRHAAIPGAWNDEL